MFTKHNIKSPTFSNGNSHNVQDSTLKPREDNLKNNPRTTATPELIIGKGAVVQGQIKDTNNIVVSGKAQIDAKGVENLKINADGEIKGNITTINADIAGEFTGTLDVVMLRVSSGAVVKGDVIYSKLLVESGGVIDGKLTPKPDLTAEITANEKNIN